MRSLFIALMLIAVPEAYAAAEEHGLAVELGANMGLIRGSNQQTAVPFSAQNQIQVADNTPVHTVTYAEIQQMTKTQVLGRFVDILGGVFMMGSSDDDPNHQPDEMQHKVKLSPFRRAETYLRQHSFVVGSIRAGLGYNPSYFNAKRYCRDNFTQYENLPGKNPRFITACPDLPVETITWQQAYDFASAMGSLFSSPIKLITEAQWEYSDRARLSEKGVVEIADTPFFFGSNDTNQLRKFVHYNYDPHSPYQTSSVFKKSDFGIKTTDEFGNVFGYKRSGGIIVWTNTIYKKDYGVEKDWFGNFVKKATVDPGKDTNPDSGATRVVRGGPHWSSSNPNPAHGRSARRGAWHPNYFSNNLGMLLVEDILELDVTE